MEIIQPQPGLDIKNRFYKAYPGIEYNVRVAVIGGMYPYTYSLTTAPFGMTINSITGVITWSNPTASGSPYSITAHIVDSENSTADVSWTVNVTTNGFLFVDAVNGTRASGLGCSSNCGTGTISNPFKSIKDFYCTAANNCSSADKTTTTYQNNFIYFRSGTYNVNEAYIEDGERVPLVVNYKPEVWLAYPGDTAPVLKMDGAYLIFYSGATNVYLDGLDIDMTGSTFHFGVQVDCDSTNVTFYRNTFHNIEPSTGPYNQSALFITAGGSSQGTRYAIQNNTFYNIYHGYGILGYETKQVLVQDNTFYNFNSTASGEWSSHPIGPKEGTQRWQIVHNNLYDINQDGIWVMYSNARGWDTGDIEIMYNRLKKASDADVHSTAIDINQYGPITGGPTYVYNNTIDGGEVVFYKPSSTNGPFYIYNNIFVNSTNYTNHVECRNCTNNLDARVILTNNLSGYPSDGILDANSNLTSAYSSFFGTHGYQIDVIPSDTTPPFAPTNLVVN